MSKWKRVRLGKVLTRRKDAVGIKMTKKIKA